MQFLRFHALFVAPVITFPLVAGHILDETATRQEAPTSEELSCLPVPVSPRSNPLHVAAYEGDVERTQFLLAEAGSDPDVKDPEERTPLHWATPQDKSEIAEVLIGQAANPDEQNRDKQVPLHEAVNHTSLDTVETLVYSGAEVNIQDKVGNTPLHNAAFRVSLHDEEAYKKQQKVHNVLLFVGNADPNVQNNDGDTSLIGAAGNGSPEMVQAQLKADADIYITNNKGKTPAHAAAKPEKKTLVRNELCPKTDNREPSEMAKLLTRQVQMASREKGSQEVQMAQSSFPRFSNRPTLAISNYNMKGNYDRLPPILASLMNHLEASPFFTQVADDPRSGHLKVAEILINADDDNTLPNATDNDGNTPLHDAAWTGDKKMAKILIKAGSDPKAKNNAGKTPLDIARERGHRDMVQALKRQLRITIPMPFGF